MRRPTLRERRGAVQPARTPALVRPAVCSMNATVASNEESTRGHFSRVVDRLLAHQAVVFAEPPSEATVRRALAGLDVVLRWLGRRRFVTAVYAESLSATSSTVRR
jgi:hypothetical protein